MCTDQGKKCFLLLVKVRVALMHSGVGRLFPSPALPCTSRCRALPLASCAPLTSRYSVGNYGFAIASVAIQLTRMYFGLAVVKRRVGRRIAG
jgi:hypothetical protein